MRVHIYAGDKIDEATTYVTYGGGEYMEQIRNGGSADKTYIVIQTSCVRGNGRNTYKLNE